jgi:hypothetical protein
MKRLKWVIPLIIVLTILLIPLPMRMKDGGSVTYAAIAYQVTDYHMLTEEDGVHGYTEGYGVTIFGIKAYEHTEFVPETTH